jgi:hypothetical protein
MLITIWAAAIVRYEYSPIHYGAKAYLTVANAKRAVAAFKQHGATVPIEYCNQGATRYA